MSLYTPTFRLSHAGALKILQAAVAKAEEMKVPQCIIIVDQSGETLASIRMDGAKFLSLRSAHKKALTAASSGVATGGIDPAAEQRMSSATDGKVTNLLGGLPIVVEGQVIGAIGVGSGTGAQDVECGQAGLAALNA